MKGRSHSPDAAFYERWQTSPLSDDYMAQMALDVAKQMHFGTPGATDLMGISFSALDRVGHAFGPQSHEVQDTLVRLDRSLGSLFSGLDALVGPGNYVVALVADHGVAPVPEQMLAHGIDAGRITPSQFTEQLEGVFRGVLGPGHYVAHVVSTHVYLNAGVFEQLKKHEGLAAVRGRDQVAAVRCRRLHPRPDRGDAARRNSIKGAIARSDDPRRSGDLTILLLPYWIAYASATTHGTVYGYDTRVPMLLMGRICPGQYLAPARPLDLAPTLAFLAGVTLPRAEGRVLVEGLTAGRGAAIRSTPQTR